MIRLPDDVWKVGAVCEFVASVFELGQGTFLPRHFVRDALKSLSDEAEAEEEEPESVEEHRRSPGHDAEMLAERHVVHCTNEGTDGKNRNRDAVSDQRIVAEAAVEVPTQDEPQREPGRQERGKSFGSRTCGSVVGKDQPVTGDFERCL